MVNYYVILQEIWVNGRFEKVISTIKTITVSLEPRVDNGRGHVELPLLLNDLMTRVLQYTRDKIIEKGLATF